MAISARVADECNRVLGQESSEAEAANADLVCGAKGNLLDAWKASKASKPVVAGDVRRTAVDARRALTWEMADGVRTVKARLAPKGSGIPSRGMAVWQPRDA